MAKQMFLKGFDINHLIQLIDPSLLILILGALFLAAFIVSIVSFYLDEYWEDADFRKELRYGKRE